jgi:hypothetical protein
MVLGPEAKGDSSNKKSTNLTLRTLQALTVFLLQTPAKLTHHAIFT